MSSTHSQWVTEWHSDIPVENADQYPGFATLSSDTQFVDSSLNTQFETCFDLPVDNFVTLPMRNFHLISHHFFRLGPYLNSVLCAWGWVWSYRHGLRQVTDVHLRGGKGTGPWSTSHRGQTLKRNSELCPLDWSKGPFPRMQILLPWGEKEDEHLLC